MCIPFPTLQKSTYCEMGIIVVKSAFFEIKNAENDCLLK